MRGSAVLAAALLGAALAAAGTDAPPEAPAHTVSEVLFCQPEAPSLGLALTFDADQLFWFDFPMSRWTPRLPELPPWPPGLETPPQLLRDATLCQQLRRALTEVATGQIPEARGVPVAMVFPQAPAALGQPNTLVCLVENIFPPAVSVGWRLHGVPVTRGVTHTHYTPTADMAFVRFSYLAVTPAAGDVYSCVVTREGDNSSVVAYWVPQDSGPAEELETALCGAAMALGVLLGLLGVAMMVLARRRERG